MKIGKLLVMVEWASGAEMVEIYLVKCTMFPCRLLGQERTKLFHKRVSLAILE